jgi:PIN domain nuclease of toxin-antitoxin system
MRVLLDTHVLLWLATEPELLSPAATRLIEDRQNDLYVSAVSVVELSIKVRVGKLPNPGGPVRDFVATVVARLGANELPLSANHGSELERLPGHDRDPFDLMLIAQARVEGMPLVTNDAEVARYDIDVVW